MSKPAYGYEPESVPHPGGSLSDFIEEWGMSVEDFAPKINEDIGVLEKIVKEEAPIGKRLAHKLAEFLGIPEDFFVSYQADYDAYEKEEEEWAATFPSDEVKTFLNLRGSLWKQIHVFFDSCNWKSWEKYIGENPSLNKRKMLVNKQGCFSRFLKQKSERKKKTNR